MKQFKWNEGKNIWLQETRGISFEEKQALKLDEEEIEILEAFEEGKLKKMDMREEEIEELKIAARETLNPIELFPAGRPLGELSR